MNHADLSTGQMIWNSQTSESAVITAQGHKAGEGLVVSYKLMSGPDTGETETVPQSEVLTFWEKFGLRGGSDSDFEGAMQGE